MTHLIAVSASIRMHTILSYQEYIFFFFFFEGCINHFKCLTPLKLILKRVPSKKIFAHIYEMLKNNHCRSEKLKSHQYVATDYIYCYHENIYLLEIIDYEKQTSADTRNYIRKKQRRRHRDIGTHVTAFTNRQQPHDSRLKENTRLVRVI